MGKIATNMTRQFMNAGLEPPKSKITKLTSNPNQPLFDTGRLIGSIAYKVEGGGQS